MKDVYELGLDIERGAFEDLTDAQWQKFCELMDGEDLDDAWQSVWHVVGQNLEEVLKESGAV
jgi:hypothetical protein|tara:strand:+ start:380 stop:565 length:186 start_codon:yes stop_codon:yes gene_type:complete